MPDANVPCNHHPEDCTCDDPGPAPDPQGADEPQGGGDPDDLPITEAIIADLARIEDGGTTDPEVIRVSVMQARLALTGWRDRCAPLLRTSDEPGDDDA